MSKSLLRLRRAPSCARLVIEVSFRVEYFLDQGRLRNDLQGIVCARESEFRTVVSFFVVFLCVRQYFFPGSENSYSSHRFQILHRGKPQIDIKVGFFFNETKFSACITTFTKVFGKIHQLLHHWYWSVIPVCRTRRRACWFSPEEDCSERSTEVIIIISKPRRRLTHTWNPFFFSLGMRRDNVHYLFTNKHTQMRGESIAQPLWRFPLFSEAGFERMCKSFM